MTSHDLRGIKIPAVMPNDRNAIQLAVDAGPITNKAECRLVWMENTLHPDRFFVSEALVSQVLEDPRLRLIGEAIQPVFDVVGNLAERPSQRLYTVGG